MLSTRMWGVLLSCLALFLRCTSATEAPLPGNKTDIMFVTSSSEFRGDIGNFSSQTASPTPTTHPINGESNSTTQNLADLTTPPAVFAWNDTLPLRQNSTLQSGTIGSLLLNESTALPTTLLPTPDNQHQKDPVTNGNATEKNATLHDANDEKKMGGEHNATDATTFAASVTTSRNQEKLPMDSSTTDANKEVLSEMATNKLSDPTGPSTSDGLELTYTATSLDAPLSGNLTHLMSTPAGELTSTVIDAQSVAPTDGLVSLPPLHVSASADPGTTPPAPVRDDSPTSGLPPTANDASASTTQLPVDANSTPSLTSPAAEPILPNQTVSPQSLFVLQFTGNTRNCSIEKQYSDLEDQIRNIFRDKARVPTQKLSLNVVNCSKSFFMNVGVSKEYESSVSEFLKNLSESNSTKFRINDETYHVNLLTTAMPGMPDAHRQPPQVILSSRHTDIEYVIYVALGSACAFLLTLAIVLVTCKYCRTKPYKSFDLNDVSHLSHRLEDYSLRQIPRPKSVYVDYCRRLPAGSDHYSPLEEQAGNGMVHAFDTSVVPLEDVPIKEAQEASLKSPPRTEEDQMINSKSEVNHEYEEIDMNAVNSTENLHNQQPSQKAVASHWGVDNDSFTT